MSYWYKQEYDTLREDVLSSIYTKIEYGVENQGSDYLSISPEVYHREGAIIGIRKDEVMVEAEESPWTGFYPISDLTLETLIHLEQLLDEEVYSD